MHKFTRKALILNLIFSMAFSVNLNGQDTFSSLEKILEPKGGKISIMFLGSYHMSNPNADAYNVEADDVLLPKRQQEINEVIDLIKKFKPTKIAIEAPKGDSLTLARYKSYLSNTLKLRRSEEEQIGFRLAKLLGHETIYPVDIKLKLNYGDPAKLVQSNPKKFGKYFAKLEEVGNKAVNVIGEWLHNGTIREVLYNMNNPIAEEVGHQMYFYSFIPIVEGNNYAGANLVSTWYKRNLQIFSNLNEIATNPNDRILVVYGQGHIATLKQFAKDSPFFAVEDVLKYLKK